MKAAGLRSRRLDAAKAAFENYDFGSADVVAADPFEWTEPGNEMSRVIYIEGEDGENSARGGFTVRFVPGLSEIAEVYAIQGGNLFGNMRMEA